MSTHTTYVSRAREELKVLQARRQKLEAELQELERDIRFLSRALELDEGTNTS